MNSCPICEKPISDYSITCEECSFRQCASEGFFEDEDITFQDLDVYGDDY